MGISNYPSQTPLFHLGHSSLPPQTRAGTVKVRIPGQQAQDSQRCGSSLQGGVQHRVCLGWAGRKNRVGWPCLACICTSVWTAPVPSTDKWPHAGRELGASDMHALLVSSHAALFPVWYCCLSLSLWGTNTGDGTGRWFGSEDTSSPGLLCVLCGHIPPLASPGSIPQVPTAQSVRSLSRPGAPSTQRQGHLKGIRDITGHLFSVTHVKHFWRQDILRHLLSLFVIFEICVYLVLPTVGHDWGDLLSKAPGSILFSQILKTGESRCNYYLFFP